MNLHEFLTPAITCSPDWSLAKAAAEMDRHGVGSIVIIDTSGKPIGILTDRDIVVRAVAQNQPASTLVTELMTTNVVTLRDDSDLFDAARLMAASGCRRLPVVDANGTLKGIVTLDDLMCLFADQTSHLARVIEAELSTRQSEVPVR